MRLKGNLSFFKVEGIEFPAFFAAVDQLDSNLGILILSDYMHDRYGAQVRTKILTPEIRIAWNITPIKWPEAITLFLSNGPIDVRLPNPTRYGTERNLKVETVSVFGGIYPTANVANQDGPDNR